MGTERRRFLLSLAAAALLALPAAARAQENKSAIEVPMLDPWVPPAVADKAILAPQTQGEALRAQVRAKLKRRFDAAASPDGTLTAAQARSAGRCGQREVMDAEAALPALFEKGAQGQRHAAKGQFVPRDVGLVEQLHLQ